MTKEELIDILKTRIAYNEDRRAYYEGLHAEEVAKGDTISIWSENVEWHKGKIVAFNIALELAEELDH